LQRHVSLKGDQNAARIDRIVNQAEPLELVKVRQRRDHLACHEDRHGRGNGEPLLPDQALQLRQRAPHDVITRGEELAFRFAALAQAGQPRVLQSRELL